MLKVLTRASALLLLSAACQAPREPAQNLAGTRRTLEALRCIRRQADSTCAMLSVSVYELLARPEIYDGQRVLLSGFLHVAFESSALYAHQEDATRRIYSNSLWLVGSSADSLNDRYVTVEGRFNAKQRGHLGLWNGSIAEVSSIVPLASLDPDSLRAPIPSIDLGKPPGS